MLGINVKFLTYNKTNAILYDDGELLQFMDNATYEQEGLTY